MYSINITYEFILNGINIFEIPVLSNIIRKIILNFNLL